MPLLPVGTVFLLNVFAKLFAPPVSVYAAFSLFNYATSIQLHQGLVWTCVALAYPLLSFTRKKRASLSQHREMESMGATEVPQWKGKWPGNIDLLLKVIEETKSNYIGQSFAPYFESLGYTWRMNVLGKGAIFTVEPEHIKEILATRFDDFEKGELIVGALQDVLGSGVFNSDGDMWKFHRSMTRPFFSRDRISHFHIFERHADRVLDSIAQRLREGHAVDIQDAFLRFTIDSASEFLFGSCVHSIDDGLPYPQHVRSLQEGSGISVGASDKEDFARAVTQVEDTIIKRLQLGFLWPLPETFSSKTARPMKVIDAYLEPILSAAIERRNEHRKLNPSEKENPDEIEEDETLVDHLLKVTDDMKLLKDEVLNMMLAGRDTTASTLTFVTYMLAIHPEMAKRLRAEIIEKVGNTRCPTYDDIREMKYMRAFINETLRLYPVVPFNGRRSGSKATTLKATSPGAKPFYIPAQTGVSYSVFIMQRRTDLWGPDALEFDPDRFLDERLHKYLTPNPFIFLPFNAGPRICLGQQFAYNEVSFMLVRLMQRFDRFELDVSAQPPETVPPPSWRSAPGRQAAERIWPKANLTIYAFGGMWVKMREAVAGDE